MRALVRKDFPSSIIAFENLLNWKKDLTDLRGEAVGIAHFADTVVILNSIVSNIYYGML